MKTRKIGAGCWNGYGGGIEGEETPEEAAVREFKEESGGATVKLEDLQKMAIADFKNTTEDGTSFTCRVHVFLVEKWAGEPTSTEVMATPTWFKRVGGLPLDQLMAADRAWLPTVLTYYPVHVNATYTPHQKEVIGSVDVKPEKFN